MRKPTRLQFAVLQALYHERIVTPAMLVRRLKTKAGAPVAPSAAAEILSTLAKKGRCVRVAYGQYVHPDKAAAVIQQFNHQAEKRALRQKKWALGRKLRQHESIKAAERLWA